ncbi:UNVERIFIED_ORG: putative copper export protein [Rhizobium etli]
MSDSAVAWLRHWLKIKTHRAFLTPRTERVDRTATAIGVQQCSGLLTVRAAG